MSSVTNMQTLQHVACCAIDDVVLAKGDPAAHDALVLVREHLDARIEQTAVHTSVDFGECDPDEDLL